MIIIYSDDLATFDEISNATAVQMSAYYNDIGKLIIDVPINAENVALFKNGRIVYDTVKKLAFVIKNVKTDTIQNRITVNGYTTNAILNERVVAWFEAFTNVESGVLNIVNGNLRDLHGVSVAEAKGLTEATSSVTQFGGQLLDGVMPVLAGARLGNRMNWNHSKRAHTFEIYKGKDLTSKVIFSEEQGTARDLVITDDDSEFYNVVYAAAEYDDRLWVQCVEPDIVPGPVRREKWVEFSISPSGDESSAFQEFTDSLVQLGLEELKKEIKKLSVSAVIDPSELGVEYNIGDLVTCVSKRFGLRFTARVIGVKYKKDVKSETTELVLGEVENITMGG